jgi:hypothetical protein
MALTEHDPGSSKGSKTIESKLTNQKNKIQRKTLYLISMWTKNTNSFNNLLNSSKGRDKFCQLLQYTANFYVTCMKSSAVYGKQARDKKIASVNRMKNLES